MPTNNLVITVTYSDGRASTVAEGTLEQVLTDLLAFEDGSSVIVHSLTEMEVYNTWRE